MLRARHGRHAGPEFMIRRLKCRARSLRGPLVAPAPQGALFGGLSGEDAGRFGRIAFFCRDAADGDFVLLGELFFLLTGGVPGGEEPTGFWSSVQWLSKAAKSWHSWVEFSRREVAFSKRF